MLDVMKALKICLILVEPVLVSQTIADLYYEYNCKFWHILMMHISLDGFVSLIILVTILSNSSSSTMKNETKKIYFQTLNQIWIPKPFSSKVKINLTQNQKIIENMYFLDKGKYYPKFLIILTSGKVAILLNSTENATLSQNDTSSVLETHSAKWQNTTFHNVVFSLVKRMDNTSLILKKNGTRNQILEHLFKLKNVLINKIILPSEEAAIIHAYLMKNYVNMTRFRDNVMNSALILEKHTTVNNDNQTHDLTLSSVLNMENGDEPLQNKSSLVVSFKHETEETTSNARSNYSYTPKKKLLAQKKYFTLLKRSLKKENESTKLASPMISKPSTTTNKLKSKIEKRFKLDLNNRTRNTVLHSLTTIPEKPLISLIANLNNTDFVHDGDKHEWESFINNIDSDFKNLSQIFTNLQTIKTTKRYDPDYETIANLDKLYASNMKRRQNSKLVLAPDITDDSTRSLWDDIETEIMPNGVISKNSLVQKRTTKSAVNYSLEEVKFLNDLEMPQTVLPLKPKCSSNSSKIEKYHILQLNRVMPKLKPKSDSLYDSDKKINDYDKKKPIKPTEFFVQGSEVEEKSFVKYQKAKEPVPSDSDDEDTEDPQHAGKEIDDASTDLSFPLKESYKDGSCFASRLLNCPSNNKKSAVYTLCHKICSNVGDIVQLLDEENKNKQQKPVNNQEHLNEEVAERKVEKPIFPSTESLKFFKGDISIQDEDNDKIPLYIKKYIHTLFQQYVNQLKKQPVGTLQDAKVSTIFKDNNHQKITPDSQIYFHQRANHPNVYPKESKLPQEDTSIQEIKYDNPYYLNPTPQSEDENDESKLYPDNCSEYKINYLMKYLKRYFPHVKKKRLIYYIKKHFECDPDDDENEVNIKLKDVRNLNDGLHKLEEFNINQFLNNQMLMKGAISGIPLNKESIVRRPNNEYFNDETKSMLRKDTFPGENQLRRLNNGHRLDKYIGNDVQNFDDQAEMRHDLEKKFLSKLSPHYLKLICENPNSPIDCSQFPMIYSQLYQNPPLETAVEPLLTQDQINTIIIISVFVIFVTLLIVVNFHKYCRPSKEAKVDAVSNDGCDDVDKIPSILLCDYEDDEDKPKMPLRNMDAERGNNKIEHSKQDDENSGSDNDCWLKSCKGKQYVWAPCNARQGFTNPGSFYKPRGEFR